MALCRQKTQGLDFLLHAKYLQELRLAGFVATDDRGRRALMKESGGGVGVGVATDADFL